MTPRNKNLDTLVSHGFGFNLDSKLLAESYFVSLRETVTSGAKNRNRFDFLGFDLYPIAVCFKMALFQTHPHAVTSAFDFRSYADAGR